MKRSTTSHYFSSSSEPLEKQKKQKHKLSESLLRSDTVLDEKKVQTVEAKYVSNTSVPQSIHGLTKALPHVQIQTTKQLAKEFLNVLGKGAQDLCRLIQGGHMLYIVYSLALPVVVKCGYTIQGQYQLLHRYKQIFGDHVTILTFRCHSRSDETQMHRELKAFLKEPKEWYHPHHLHEIIEIVSKRFGKASKYHVKTCFKYWQEQYELLQDQIQYLLYQKDPDKVRIQPKYPVFWHLVPNACWESIIETKRNELDSEIINHKLHKTFSRLKQVRMFVGTPMVYHPKPSSTFSTHTATVTTTESKERQKGKQDTYFDLIQVLNAFFQVKDTVLTEWFVSSYCQQQHQQHQHPSSTLSSSTTKVPLLHSHSFRIEGHLFEKIVCTIQDMIPMLKSSLSLCFLHSQEQRFHQHKLVDALEKHLKSKIQTSVSATSSSTDSDFIDMDAFFTDPASFSHPIKKGFGQGQFDELDTKHTTKEPKKENKKKSNEWTIGDEDDDTEDDDDDDDGDSDETSDLDTLAMKFDVNDYMKRTNKRKTDDLSFHTETEDGTEERKTKQPKTQSDAHSHSHSHLTTRTPSTTKTAATTTTTITPATNLNFLQQIQSLSKQEKEQLLDKLLS